MSRRREVLRRLGSPRYRCVCPSCRHYVPRLWLTFIIDPGSQSGMREIRVCDSCKSDIEKRNRQVSASQLQNELGLERANHEHQLAATRSSRHDYLIACINMRQELRMK